MVYLVHFDTKLYHSKHYLGYCADTADGIEKRMKLHRSGQGSRILKRCNELGITYFVARIWPDASRHYERKLKRAKNASRFCPVCRAEKERKNHG